jgi:hypothetical protein
MINSVAGGDNSTYARISEKLLSSGVQITPGRFLYIDDNNRVHIGTKSLHRTASARVWRLFWRLKRNRVPHADQL